MGRTLTYFVAFIAVLIVQVKSTDSENTNASDSWFQWLRDITYKVLKYSIGLGSTSSKSWKILDIGSNWVYLSEGHETRVQCYSIDESAKSDSEPWNVPCNISLMFNHTYTCTTEGSADSGITFKPGAGDVIDFKPGNSAHFEDEGESCEFRCEVKIHDVKTDTVWSLEREGELQTISSDHLFEISGDQRPQSESNFGNLLKIRNCSSGRLNGTLLYCGSHTHPKQDSVTLKVCEKPNVTIDNNIWLEEGTKSCSVAAIKSPIKASHFNWHKNEEVISEQHVRYRVSGEEITFNNVERGDMGHYSVTADMSCHEHSKLRQVGNFSLNIIYGPELTEADKNYSACEGDSVKLICGSNLDSNPVANISWTNAKGEPITNNEKYTINNGPEEVSLEIAGVNKDDNGTWTCTVHVVVPVNVSLYCYSKQERIKAIPLQLIVVIPPSEPRNLRVNNVTSSSFCICWDEPLYRGSPCLSGYIIFYGDRCEKIDVTIDNCFSFDSDYFEWGQIYSINVFAVSEIENKPVKGNSSANLTLITDRPTQLRVTDISSSQVTLTWDELSGALPQDHLYNVTCDGTAQGSPTTKNSYVISGLSQSTVYNCTVSETGIVNSLCSFEVLFMPGAGDVTNSSPANNTVIAHFEGERESCDLTCVVKNNDTQTDTVWSIENYMGKSKHQITSNNVMFTISGEKRPLSELDYGNRLKIHNCSLNGTTIFCGSHKNPEQILFKFEVCEKPVITIDNEIWLDEGTKSCSVIAIRSTATASHFTWHKNEEIISTSEHVRYLFTEEGVTFSSVERDDIGNYSVTADMSCHEHSKSEIIGHFSLNVIYGPELTEADETYSAHEGDSVKLICGSNLVSNPVANISWTNAKGEPITNSEKYTINNGPEEVSLDIAGVYKDDNGTWTCTVAVPVNVSLYCYSELERIQAIPLQLIVHIPPSEPRNLRMKNVTSSSFCICWDEPVYRGSPYLSGYNISYGDRCEKIDVTTDNCFSFDSDYFEWGQIYSINLFAVSEVENKSVKGNSSANLTLITDRPGQLRVTDISSSQVTLTWDKLSGALPNQLYNISCNGTASAPGPQKTNNSFIPGLSPSTIYNCTVVGISKTSYNSLRSFEVLFMPGAGNVTSSDPDNKTIITYFQDEGENCNFICKVHNNGTQTDTVWSFKSGSDELEKITGGHISGNYRPGSQSHYSNHLQIMDCSLLELDGVIVFCGSHVSPKQAYFELKVCEQPHQITPSVIQVIEGTKRCPITVVSTNLRASDIRWEKDGKRIWEEFEVGGFTITFNNVTRKHAGNYSVTSSIICHDDKTKQITRSFALDVIYPPTVTTRDEQSHKVNETETVILICGLQSNPSATITWIAPNGTVILSDKESYSQGDVVQLNITSADRNDRGQWTCNMDVPDINICVYNCLDDEKLSSSGHDGQQPQAKCSRNSFTNASVTSNLDVFYGPDIKSESMTLQSSLMSEIKMIIGLESNPPATITWINPAGESVENGSGYSYQSPIRGSKDVTLTITSVSEKDEGTWNCNILVKDGENEIGRKVVYIKLSVDDGSHTITSREMITIIVCTIIFGTAIIIVMQKLKVAKASKPTVPESKENAITKPQISDKIPANPYASQVAHSSVTSTQESRDDSVEGDISDPILTKTKLGEVQKEKSLAETLRSLSKRICSTGSHPDIYYPIMKKLDGAVTKCIITVDIDKSTDEFQTPINEKVLMLVGPTGAGKSTLINGIANYIMGVRWQDDFRFKVIVNEGEMSQVHSQTSEITAYTFHNSNLPYTLTVIDTPGFGDTRGIENDKIIVEQIRALFSVGGIDQIHGVGFVTDAASARLTPTVRYVFDSILSIFGKDIASNIFLLLTFSDGQEPPVLSAIKEAAIPYKADFKFNNSALFVKCSTGTFDEMFWGLGMENFDKFFREFESVEPHSLHLTRENLNERQHLEAVIEGLKMQIRVILAKIDVLRQKQYILRKREAEILQSQHFTYEVTVSKQRQIELPKNVFVTNCHQCQFTCHYPCPVSIDNEKYRCKAMDGGGPDSARCTVCPGNCPWSQHANATYRFEIYYEVETQTSDDLKKNLFEAIEGKSQIESMIADIEKELEMFQGVIVGMVSEAKQSLERLQDIALKPNPLSEIEYIDLLIKAENSEKNPGFTERIKAFEMIKNIVKTQGAVASGKKTDSTWWKSILARK